MIEDTAEKCRGCTLKHLSEALVWLDNTTTNPRLRCAYICGNLGHAANHFIHYSPEIADKIRQLRLDSINNDLTQNLGDTEIRSRLEGLLEEVGAYQETPPPEPEIKTPVVRAQMPVANPTPTGGGCRCRQKH